MRPRASADGPRRSGEDGGMSAVWVLDEDDALELLAYLVTAARTQVDEAAEYGPMRLLTAARRSRCRCLPCPGTTETATSRASTMCAARWPSTSPPAMDRTGRRHDRSRARRHSQPPRGAS